MRYHLSSHIFLLIIFVLFGRLSAEPDPNNKAPWDTLMAELQVIESMKEPDSVKAALTQDLFDKYNLQAADYNRFYSNFLEESPEQKLSFLKKVENIILEMLKHNYDMKREDHERSATNK